MSSPAGWRLGEICREIVTEVSVIVPLADCLLERKMITDATYQDAVHTTGVVPYTKVSKLLYPIVTRLNPDSLNYDPERAQHDRENLLDALRQCGFGGLASRLAKIDVESKSKDG